MRRQYNEYLLYAIASSIDHRKVEPEELGASLRSAGRLRECYDMCHVELHTVHLSKAGALIRYRPHRWT